MIYDIPCLAVSVEWTFLLYPAVAWLTCELVGSFLLCQHPDHIREQVGLYRDDGLGAFNKTPRQIEEIKKKICKVFSFYGLKITIEANKKTIDFLDVTLDLNKGSYDVTKQHSPLCTSGK